MNSKDKSIYIGILVILAIVISFFIGFSVFNNTHTDTLNEIEKYDSVKLDFTMWESDDHYNYDVLDTLIDEVLWLDVIPITENKTTGLILGIYNSLIGKEINYRSGIFWLDRCIDEDRDGVDDLTKEHALTYGNPADLYFNTSLMVQFTVLDIEKK